MAPGPAPEAVRGVGQDGGGMYYFQSNLFLRKLELRLMKWCALGSLR